MPVHCGLGGPSLRCRQLQRLQQAGSLWRNLPCEDWLAKSWQAATGGFFFFFSLCSVCTFMSKLLPLLSWMEAKCLSFIFKAEKRWWEESGIPVLVWVSSRRWWKFVFLVRIYRFRYLRVLWFSCFYFKLLKASLIKIKNDTRRQCATLFLHSPTLLIEDSNINSTWSKVIPTLISETNQTYYINVLSLCVSTIHWEYLGLNEGWKKLLFIECHLCSRLDFQQLEPAGPHNSPLRQACLVFWFYNRGQSNSETLSNLAKVTI